MKKLFLLIGLMMGTILFAQDSEAIVGALKSADAVRLSVFFDDFVDIKILDKPELKNMGRTQAGIMLKTFFAETGVTGFEKTSQRDMSGTMYLTGKLQSRDKGNNVTLMLRLKDGKWQIITLRIS